MAPSTAYYVIVRGPAGVGKTTVSRLLAGKIGAESVHFDDLMESMGLDYVEGGKWIPLSRFLTADAEMLPRYERKLRSGTNVVFDGNFYHMEQIEDIESKLDFPHYAFTLKAGIDTCIERDKERGSRLGEDATRAVFRLVSAFDYGMVMDTEGKTSEQVATGMLARIGRCGGARAKH